MDFKNIKLNPKQSLLLHSDNPATEILYGGAAGGGKSFALRIASIYYSFEIPGLQTWLLRRKSDDLRANHLEGSTGYLSLLAPYINDGTCRINHTNATIIFNNGSVIHLEHCQHEKDRLNFQGFEIHLLLIDELTHFSESIYTYIRSRCRLGSFKVPEKYQHQFPRIIAGSNPGGVGHNFVKSTFIDIQPPFEVNARPKEDGGMKRQFIPATLEDNPYIESDYEDKLYGLGDKSLVDAMRFGKWDIISGGAIDDVWNRDIDVIKPFHIPRNWYVDRGFDWGSSKPYACLWFAESNGEDFVDDYGNYRSYPAGTVFIINELYGIKNNKPNAGTMETAAEVARKIKAVETENSILQHLQIRPGPADSAIFGNNTGYDQSLYSMIYSEGVEFTSAFKGPGSRVAGLEEIRTRLINNKNFENKGLYIFNNCVNTIRTLPTLPRSESNYDDVDSNAEDHCFTGDTLVKTCKGNIPLIDLIGTEGMIYTENNTCTTYHSVRKTRKNAKILKLTFSDGFEVRCTPDHKFLTNMGWIEAKDLLDVDCYHVINTYKKDSKTWKLSLFQKQFKNLTGFDIINVVNIFKQKVKDFIEKSGFIIMVKYLVDFMYIINQKIKQEIISVIWNYWKNQSIYLFMLLKQIILKQLNLHKTKQENGINQKKGENGINYNMKKINLRYIKDMINYVKSVGMNIKDHIIQNFVQTPVKVQIEERKESTTSQKYVNHVERNFKQTNIHQDYTVKVVKIEDAGKEDVYCLVADKTHSFALSNGMIVSNCYDVIRYKVLNRHKIASATFDRFAVSKTLDYKYN